MNALKVEQDQEDKEREAAVACAMQLVLDFVDSMAGASPESAERKARQLRSLHELDQLLPEDFKRKVMQRARDEECIANMRKCDQLLRETVALSVADRMAERSGKLMEARRYFVRASQLGAGPEWCKAFQRAEEAIRLTGGMHHSEPSRAKPQDNPTLRAPNRAKLH
jgi:hypothetical protein